MLCRITKKGLCNALKALGGAWATTPESHRRICSSPAGLKTRGCELPEEDGFCIQNACLNANLHKTTQPGRALIMRQDDCACRCFAVCVRECGFEIGFLGGEKKKADNGLRCVWAMRESVDFGVIE